MVTSWPGERTESEADLQRRISMHLVSIPSEQMLRRLISNPNSETRKTNWFTSAQNPLERVTWLRDHLRVRRITGTALIEMTLSDVPDPRERVTILREIGDQYLRDARQIASDALMDQTQVLNTLRTKLDVRLKQITEDMRARSVQLNLEGGGVGRIGIKEMELTTLTSKLVDAQIHWSKSSTDYEGLVNLAKEGRPLPGIETLVENDDRLKELQRRLDDVELRLEVAKTAGGSKPAVKDPLDSKDATKPSAPTDSTLAALRIESAFLEKKIATRSNELTARGKTRMLETAAIEYQNSAAQLESLKQRVENLKNDLGDLSNAVVAYYTLQDEQKSLREQLKDVRARIEQAMTLQSTAASAGIRWHLMPQVDAH